MIRLKPTSRPDCQEDKNMGSELQKTAFTSEKADPTTRVSWYTCSFQISLLIFTVT